MDVEVDGGMMAHVSITWVPWVFITFMVWLVLRGTATPVRAGIVWVLFGGYFDDGREDILWACELTLVDGGMKLW